MDTAQSFSLFSSLHILFLFFSKFILRFFSFFSYLSLLFFPPDSLSKGLDLSTDVHFSLQSRILSEERCFLLTCFVPITPLQCSDVNF